jgi:hypothetical protein
LSLGPARDGEPDDGGEEVNMDNLVVKDEVTEDDSIEDGRVDGIDEADTKVNMKREARSIEDAPAAKRPCKEDAKSDVEDSINLDIGEDEFLNDEVSAINSIFLDFF